MINEELGIMFVGQSLTSSEASRERFYNDCVDSFSCVGFKPTLLGARAPGVSSRRYGRFGHKHPRLVKAGIGNAEWFELLHLPNGCTNESTQAVLRAGLITGSGQIFVGLVPAVVGAKCHVLAALYRRACEQLGVRYGYEFRQQMSAGMFWYMGGANYGDVGSGRHPETRMNISWWSGHAAKACATAGILRDIYPHNYLSSPYLDAPIGKTAMTLREWIQHDPTRRGTLSTYTDLLTEWTPPIEQIPAIREALYRAGRVFYWRFLSSTRRVDGVEQPEPLFRPDLSAPWEAPDPIPEIYRADFWKDKDPGLTY